MTRQFQTELEQAKEMAKYELEQEHLENLKQLETSLQQQHAEQLSGLMRLQGQHEEEKKLLKVCVYFRKTAVFKSQVGPSVIVCYKLFY